MSSKEERLAELQSRGSLNDNEFAELVALSPPGAHVKLPNLNVAGLRDLQQALENVVDAGARTKRAFEAGFYVEVIALRSQSVELFLRLYLGAKLHAGGSFPVDDRRPLGALIDESEKRRFSPTVIALLRDFNEDRINGLHRYLLGAASYDSLKGVCERSTGLTKQVVDVIAAEFGKPA